MHLPSGDLFRRNAQRVSIAAANKEPQPALGTDWGHGYRRGEITAGWGSPVTVLFSEQPPKSQIALLRTNLLSQLVF